MPNTTKLYCGNSPELAIATFQLLPSHIHFARQALVDERLKTANRLENDVGLRNRFLDLLVGQHNGAIQVKLILRTYRIHMSAGVIQWCDEATVLFNRCNIKLVC